MRALTGTALHTKPDRVTYDRRGRALRRDGLADLSPDDSEYLDSFCSRPEISPASRKWYHERVGQFGAFLAQRRRTYLTASADDYRAFWSWQIDRGVAQNSIDASYRAVAAFYRYLQAEGFRDDQPLARVPRPGVEQTIPKTYDPDDLLALLDHFKRPRTLTEWRARVALEMLLECGLRSSELLGLTFDDIDHRQLLVSVRPGKTKRGRTVAITQQVSLSVLHYKAQLKRSSALFQCNLLMPSMRSGDPGGTALTPSGLYQAIENAFREAGLNTRAGVHKFRHECLKQLILGGTDIRTVSEIAGHSSITVTEHYGKLWSQERHAIHREHSPLKALQRRASETTRP